MHGGLPLPLCGTAVFALMCSAIVIPQLCRDSLLWDFFVNCLEKIFGRKKLHSA